MLAVTNVTNDLDRKFAKKATGVELWIPHSTSSEHEPLLSIKQTKSQCSTLFLKIRFGNTFNHLFGFSEEVNSQRRQHESAPHATPVRNAWTCRELWVY